MQTRRNRPGVRSRSRPRTVDGLGAWLLAPAGLVLVGAGLSATVDAGLRRAAGAATSRWVGQGTAGLVVLNSGLAVFGDAVRRRAQQGRRR